MACPLLFVAFCVLLTFSSGQDVPDISSIDPQIVVEVVRDTSHNNALEFYCDITPPSSNNHFYIVEWSLHTGFTLTTSLLVNSPHQYMSQEDFRRKTVLKETDLVEHGITHPGFTLGCSVKAQTHLTGDISNPQISKPKFFGLEVVNATESNVRVLGGEARTVYFKLTLPFGCLSGDCFLDFNVFTPRNVTEHCTMSHVTHTEHLAMPCGVRFYKNDIAEGTSRPFIITARVTSQLLSNTMVYDVALVTSPRVSNHRFFENYFAASVRVELAISREVLQNKKCLLEENLNILTFDGRYNKIQHHGIAIFYRHVKLQVEVQTKSDMLSFLNNPTIPINCGVAVRAGRDLFIIDHCQIFDRPAIVVLCKDGVLSRQIRKINNMYRVSLPSGTVVEVTENGRIINVAVYPSLTDFNKTEGFCGSFDLNVANDEGLRPGPSSKTSAGSWMVTSSENLFDTNNYANLTRWYEDRYLCVCERDTSLGYSQLNPMGTCDAAKRIHCPDDRTSQDTQTLPSCDLYV